ncbi:MAG: hypothetical protein AAF558_13475 [Verrucomicrobiota bacterium]
MNSYISISLGRHVLLLYLLVLALIASTSRAATVTAKRSDDFVNSMGINIKLDRTVYDNNWSQVKNRFKELGLWHYRDNLKNVNNDAKYRNRYQSLYNEVGAVGLFLWGPWENQNKPGNQVVGAAKKGLSYIRFISGPNEPDLFWPNNYDGNPNTNLWAEARNYQNQMYNALKADNATKNIPVTTPPVSNYALADDLGFVKSDLIAWHWYTGQGRPDKNEVGTGISATKSGLNKTSLPNSKVFTTESGHNSWNQVNSNNNNTVAVNELTQMHYNLRILADQYRRGIGRTYLHQLMDLGTDTNNFNHSWGIVRANTNKTPKPFFTAWKNLVSLFKERSWNTSSKSWSKPSFTPGNLNYSITGNTDAVKTLLLQKSNKDFYMLVWVAADSWDKPQKKSRTVFRNINIVFNNAKVVTRQTFNSSGAIVGAGISSSNGAKTWSFTASTIMSIVKIDRLPIGLDIAIKGSNNRFVNLQGNTKLRCNVTTINGNRKFRVIDRGNRKVAFRGNNNKFMSSENGTQPMRCNRNSIGGWEQFTWVDLGSGKFALKGSNGKFVSSENGQFDMKCNRNSIGAWEKFSWSAQ